MTGEDFVKLVKSRSNPASREGLGKNTKSDYWLHEDVMNDIDGEPCSHIGCLNHVTHPCEGCGRIGGRKNE